MQKIKKLNVESRILVIIMALSLAGLLYYGNLKEGYHVDEVYSYGLANSEYLPFMHFGESGYDVKDWMLDYGAGESVSQLIRNLINDYKILQECDFDLYNSVIYRDYLIAQAHSLDTKTTTWMQGEDYLYYIGSSPENTFNYASVYYNQRGDVHPPFFYMVLHTVCSIFQGSFSKWYGLAVNITFMMLTLLVLYRMCRRYLGGAVPALCVAAVYGLSCGFVSTAIFIRMYAIMTFMVVESCYLHLQLAEKKFQPDKRLLGKLALVTFLGFYTHYYFVIYAICIALVACVWMLCQKNFGNLLRYILTMAGTGVLGVCIWPFAFRHVFGGYRGVGAIKASLSGGDYWIKARVLFSLVWDQVIGGQWWIIVLSVVFFAVVVLLWKRKETPYGKMMMVGLPALLYAAAVSQMVPFYTDRYVMCTYPFWCIAAVGCFYHGIRILWEKMQAPETVKGVPLRTMVVAVFALLLVLFSNCYMRTPLYLYTGGQETVWVPENTDCVYVLPDGDWNESATDSTILAQCRKVGVVYESNLAALQEDYSYHAGDYLLVCIQLGLDEERVLEKVHETLETGELKEVSRTEGATAVRILFTK